MKKKHDYDDTPTESHYGIYKGNKLEISLKELKKPSTSKFNDLEIITYYVYTLRNKCSCSTTKEYLSELLSFYEFLENQSNMELKEISINSLFQNLNMVTYFEKYLEFIGSVHFGKGGKSYSKATIYRKTSVVKNFLVFLNKNNYVYYDKFDKIQYPSLQSYSNDHNKLSFQETKELIQYYKDHPILNALISILVTTGIKISELCSLKVKDVVYLDDEYWLVIRNKGEQDKKLFLLPSVMKAITTFKARRREDLYLNTEDLHPLFTTANGKAYSTTYLGNYLTKKLNNTNLSFIHNKVFTVTSATLRLTYATICKSKNNDVISLKESLGHNDIKTTELFLHGKQEK